MQQSQIQVQQIDTRGQQASKRAMGGAAAGGGPSTGQVMKAYGVPKNLAAGGTVGPMEGGAGGGVANKLMADAKSDAKGAAAASHPVSIC